MKKSKFKLTHLHSTTLDPGYLVPFCLIPTLPNDSFRLGLSTFIRAQPMLAPLMHEVRLFTQYWFVPNRIIWEEWEDFITGGNDLSLTPPFPTVKLTADDCKTGSLTDYFGFPLVEDLEVSALPYRAMAEIWNTRYRDEDLQDEVAIDYGSSEDTTTSRKLLSPSFSKDYFTTARPFTQRGGDVLVPISDSVATGTNTGMNIEYKVLVGTLTPTPATPTGSTTPTSTTLVAANPNFTISTIDSFIQSWLKARVVDGTIEQLVSDYSTDLANISGNIMDRHLAGSLGVSTYSQPAPNQNFYVWVFPTKVERITSPNTITDSNTFDVDPTLSASPFWYNNGTNPQLTFLIKSPEITSTTVRYARFYRISDKTIVTTPINPRPFSDAFTGGTAVIAQTQVSQGFTIRDLRRSSALQRYAERSLKYGNRYEEFIQREFGIKPRDYRIQRPEYLGGGAGILNISEVLQTAESADTGVGTMRGHGVASVSQRPIRFRCPEHGIILGLLSIRPKSVYTQGVDREWLKRSRLDFFTPELANIGMQEVLQQELFATADNVNEVFGYSERYQEYRYQKPLVTSEFRTTLNFWNMARLFANAPNLNAEFIDMANAVDDFKRPFQVQDNSAHAFVCMLKNHIRAYRPIPKRAKDILK